MNIVHYLVVFADVRNDLYVKALLVKVHVFHDVLHRETYRLLDLIEELHLFELVVRELVLCCAEQTFITEQLLSFFLCNHLLWRLL